MRKKITLILILISFFSATITGAVNFYTENLNSDSVYMVDYDSQVPIVEKNIDKKRSPASLTKMVTFLVTYENCKNINETKFKVNKEILDMLDPESSGSRLKEGEEFSVKDLLHCMLISSSGCSAITLAYNIGGGDVSKFVDMMNKKVSEIGCENTHFENPDGIFNEKQYSTVHDIYKIVNYAMKNQDFLDIVGKSEYSMFSDERDPVVTTNYMIDKKSGGKYYNPYVKGIKTGYTEEAGKCLASYATKDGKTYVTIVMGGPIHNKNGEKLNDNMAMIDSLTLYDWAFNNFESVKICDKYLPISQIPINYAWGRNFITLSANKDISILLPKNIDKEKIKFEFHLPDFVDAPLKKDEIIGKANIIYDGNKLSSIDLVSCENIEKNYILVVFNFINKIFTNKIFIAFFILFIILILIYIFWIFKINRRKKRKNKVIKISDFKNIK